MRVRVSPSAPVASGSSSVVERLPPKEEVASSSLVSRSIGNHPDVSGSTRRRGQVVKAEVCKTSIRRFESARRLHTTRTNTLQLDTFLCIVYTLYNLAVETGTMKCPVCNELMIVVEYEQIELDYSPDCGGVWFDAGELELLLETMKLDSKYLSIDDILNSPESPSEEKKRKCPICGKKMKKATVGNDPEVMIDACTLGHGLWFDEGEVGQLIAQSESLDQGDFQGQIVTFLGEVFQLKR